MAEFTFFEDNFMAFVNDLAGGVAQELQREADVIVQETKDHLGVDAGTQAHDRNQSNVPRSRTGRLAQSIGASDVTIVEGIITIGIGADPEVAPHARVLLGREPPPAGREARDFVLAPPRITNAQ